MVYFVVVVNRNSTDGKVANYLSDEVSHTFQSSIHNSKLLTCECLRKKIDAARYRLQDPSMRGTMDRCCDRLEEVR